MGSIIQLPMAEQQPFRRGLNLLRRILNNQDKFQQLVEQGAEEIFVLAGLWELPAWEQMFQPFIGGWATHKQLSTRFQYDPDPARNDAVEAELTLLRDVLNDRGKTKELAQIGPCKLMLSCTEDWARQHEPSILISNFIPGFWPNADWSINADGQVYFHS